MVKEKSISEINEKLKKGQAVVMTAMDFKKEVRSGYRFKVSDVDVVTTGTRGTMSGTSAMLVMPLDTEGRSQSIKDLRLNGVPCFPYANPENTPGLVDVVIYGTAESRDFYGRYGGGHVLRDLVEGKQIEVECVTSDGKSTLSAVTMDQLKFGRLYNFRNDFQNYTAFTNVKNSPVYLQNPLSIFSCRPIPLLRGITFSGSGELNPLENDVYRKVLRSGTRILLNGAPGVIVSNGTRSKAKAALFVAGDLAGMNSQFMGGFKTSFGVEVTNGIAIPFPITSMEIIDGLSQCLDENIPLPVADLSDRVGLLNIRYSHVWKGARLEVEFDPDRCICCSFQCPAEYYCPMGAISWKDKKIDENLCYACGACTSNCMGGAFKGKGDDAPRGSMGTVNLFDRDIPIIFRQSNRFRSEKLAVHLKEIMEKGEFLLTDSDLKLDLQ